MRCLLVICASCLSMRKANLERLLSSLANLVRLSRRSGRRCPCERARKICDKRPRQSMAIAGLSDEGQECTDGGVKNSTAPERSWLTTSVSAPSWLWLAGSTLLVPGTMVKSIALVDPRRPCICSRASPSQLLGLGLRRKGFVLPGNACARSSARNSWRRRSPRLPLERGG